MNVDEEEEKKPYTRNNNSNNKRQRKNLFWLDSMVPIMIKGYHALIFIE